MKLKDYLGVTFFALLTIIAGIVGIVTNNKDVLIASYSFVIMTLIAYVIMYVRTIKNDIRDLKEQLLQKR